MGGLANRLVAGTVFIILGASGTAWMWRMADAEGSFYWNVALMAPVCCVLGLAILLLPHYREERIARGEDISRVEGPSLLTLRWWLALGVAVAAGGINVVLIEITHGGSPWPTVGGMLIAAVVMYRLFRNTGPEQRRG